MKGRFFVNGGSCSWRWWHAPSSVARKTAGLCKTWQQASSSPLLPTRYKNTSTKQQPINEKEKEAPESYETDDALNSRSPHVPVLLHECLRALHIREGGLYVDATFGRGGHTQAILETNDTCRVIAVDCDATAFQQEGPRQLFQRFGERVTPIHGRFGELHALLQSAQVSRVDGILFDLGVSSPQLDTPSRGFSFRPHLSGPLDMRMDQTSSASSSSSSVVSAKEVVNQMGEEELADILWRYGEERNSRKIARNIVRYRQTAAIESTAQLANIVRRAQQQPRAGKGGAGGEKKGIDPATRTFQALRIFVNDELGQLEKGLVAAESLLAEGGHLAVISFHSLEDRIVKSFLNYCSGKKTDSLFSTTTSTTSMTSTSHLQPTSQLGIFRPSFYVREGLILPSEEETQSNPRARSAKLRTAERSSYPPLFSPASSSSSSA